MPNTNNNTEKEPTVAIHSEGYSVTCDGCGEIGEENAETKSFARMAVKEMGWAFAHGKDLCLACRSRKPKGWDNATWQEMRGRATELANMLPSDRRTMNQGLIAGLQQ